MAGEPIERRLARAPQDSVLIGHALGRFLAALHAASLADCPFDSSLGLRLHAAERRLAAGLVDESDFDPVHAGWSAKQVWGKLIASRPRASSDVLTHGDFSIGNVFCTAETITGMIDVGRAGRADPYQDIAIAWHNLGGHGQAAQLAFLQGYGLSETDEHRLQFHLTLDEFF